MAKHNLPALSNEAKSVLEGLGFRQIAKMPYTYLGKAESQNENQPAYMVVLDILPLQLDANRYVVSLRYNGNYAFQTRLLTLDELAESFTTYAVFEDIDAFVRETA